MLEYLNVDEEIGQVVGVGTSKIIKSNEIKKTFFSVRKLTGSSHSSVDDWFDQSSALTGGAPVELTHWYPSTKPSLDAVQNVILVESFQLELTPPLTIDQFKSIVNGRFVVRMSDRDIINQPLSKMICWANSLQQVSYDMISTSASHTLRYVLGGTSTALKFKDQLVLLAGTLSYKTQFFSPIDCSGQPVILRLIINGYLLTDYKRHFGHLIRVSKRPTSAVRPITVARPTMVGR